MAKVATMTAAHKNGDYWTAPHDVDPSSSDYGCRSPYTFPCVGEPDTNLANALVRYGDVIPDIVGIFV